VTATDALIGATIALTDAAGRAILLDRVTGARTMIDLRDPAPGIYVLRVCDGPAMRVAVQR
jgi:hypothetical protein